MDSNDYRPDSETQLNDQGIELLPTPQDPLPNRPRRPFGWLALLAGLIVVAGLVGGIWAISAGGSTQQATTPPTAPPASSPKPTATTAPPTSTPAPLSLSAVITYPGAVDVKLSDEMIKSGASVPGVSFGAFATTDDYKKVGDYLKQQLEKAGYVSYYGGMVSVGNQCENPDCDQIILTYQKDDTIASVVIVGPKSRQDGSNSAINQAVGTMFKADQTGVIYTSIETKNLGLATPPKPTVGSPVPYVAPSLISIKGPNISLTYPSGNVLTVEDKALFPNGRPDEIKTSIFGGFATTDDYKKVSDSFKEQLEKAGYKVEDVFSGNICDRDICKGRSYLQATKDGQQVTISVLAPNARGSYGGDMFGAIGSNSYLYYQQVRAEQVAVLYSIGPVSNYKDFVPTSNEPAPAYTPPVAGTVAYLGPDGRFHPDKGAGLVSLAKSASIKTGQANSTFQISWLLSEADGVQMGVIFKSENSYRGESPAYILTKNAFATLVDEKGRSYELKMGSGGSGSTSGGISSWAVKLSGPTLPADVRQVTFKPGPAMLIGLETPLTLSLASFKEAKLPQATAFPNASVTSNGIKVSINYAYFGPDRTVLELYRDNKELQTKYPKVTLSLFPYLLDFSTGRENYQVSDDQGRILKSASLRSEDGQDWAQRNDGRDSLMMLSLAPVAADAKGLTFKLKTVALNLWATESLSSTSTPDLKVSLPELLKTSEGVAVSQSFTLLGEKVEVTKLQAKLDSSKKTVTLNLTYRSKLAAAQLNLQRLSFECSNCPQKNSSNGVEIQFGSGTKPNPNATEATAQVTFAYDPNQTEAELKVRNSELQAEGDWQLTLPISRP